MKFFPQNFTKASMPMLHRTFAIFLFAAGSAFACLPDPKYALREQQLRELMEKACKHNEANPYLGLMEVSENPDRSHAQGIFYHKGEKNNVDADLLKLSNQEAKRLGACQQSLSEMAAYESVIRKQIEGSCEVVSQINVNCQNQNGCSTRDRSVLQLARETKETETQLLRDYRLTLEDLREQHGKVIKKLELAASNPMITENPQAQAHIQAAIEEHRQVRSLVSNRINEAALDSLQEESTLQQYDRQIAVLNGIDLQNSPSQISAAPEASKNATSALALLSSAAPLASLAGSLFSSSKVQAGVGQKGETSAASPPPLNTSGAPVSVTASLPETGKTNEKNSLSASKSNVPTSELLASGSGGLNPPLIASEPSGKPRSNLNASLSSSKVVDGSGKAPIVSGATSSASAEGAKPLDANGALHPLPLEANNSAEPDLAEAGNSGGKIQLPSESNPEPETSVEQVLANMMKAATTPESGKPADNLTEQANINASFASFLTNQKSRALASAEPNEEIGAEELSLFTRNSHRIVQAQKRGDVYSSPHNPKFKFQDH